MRLTWKKVADSPIWNANAGIFRLEVWYSGVGYPWQVGFPGHFGGAEYPFRRSVRSTPDTETLEAAQEAAEAALFTVLGDASQAYTGPRGILVEGNRVTLA